MHRIDIPAHIVERVVARRGTAHPFADLDGRRTALVVVDMQNGFLREDVAFAYVPGAVEIVPNVNRLAAAVRAAGGAVYWIQNASDERSRAEWSVMEDFTVPEKRAARARAMAPGSEGHALWPGLDVRPGDPVVAKRRYSAFIQGSSDLAERLRADGRDTLLIAGTLTNVCCESSARDAMMLNLRVVMAADANAALSDAEHNASLVNFYATFGDVMTAAELEACLARGAGDEAARNAA